MTAAEAAYARYAYFPFAPQSGDVDKNGDPNPYYKTSEYYSCKATCETACRRHAANLRKKIKRDEGSYTDESLLDAARRKKAAVAAAKKRANKAHRDTVSILAASRAVNILSLLSPLRLGDNTGDIAVRYDAGNYIECDEYKDYNGYAKSCRWTMVRRDFTLAIRKGWHVETIGGLLTFLRCPIRRNGQACEWIEQGRAISDIKTVSGYLVRGEHIEAKSLAEARRISAQHRSLRCARLLNQRKHAIERAKAAADGTLRITFADSLAAGNCRPGTQEFRIKYEEAVGRKVKYITVNDLRKYADKFGVSDYAEAVIKYVLSK